MANNIEINKKIFSLIDVVGLIVGLVVGVGIFKTPSLVAANVSNAYELIFLWTAGGFISLVGALCYAELATAFPHAGGEYHFIGRAFGRKVAFLFGWSRMTVVQTGSIAMLAFVFGDYIAQIFPLGSYSSFLYATGSIVVLTTLNIISTWKGKWTQNFLTGVKILGLLIIFLAGIFSSRQPLLSDQASQAGPAVFGLAMIFVLLTYGGWNEAAYVSSELCNVERNMVRSLVWGISIITIIYVLINLVFVKTLGVPAMARSEAVAWDMMHRIAGDRGATLISAIVSISALGSINATMITGARTNFALGKDFSLLRIMGGWHETTGSPVNALIVQGIISLLLVFFGTLTRKGFVTVVEYTAPVFWLFFLLTTVSLIVLRRREPGVFRHFKVPFYPVTPLLFAAVCGYMLISSIEYTGIGALIGVAVLLAGIPFLLISEYRKPVDRQ